LPLNLDITFSSRNNELKIAKNGRAPKNKNFFHLLLLVLQYCQADNEEVKNIDKVNIENKIEFFPVFNVFPYTATLSIAKLSLAFNCTKITLKRKIKIVKEVIERTIRIKEKIYSLLSLLSLNSLVSIFLELHKYSENIIKSEKASEIEINNINNF